MRTNHLLPTAFLLAILPLVIPATAQKITTDYDRGANFSDYHTYAWTEGTPIKDPLVDQRIRTRIDKQLASKGHSKVSNPEQADILVTYNAALDQLTPCNAVGIDCWSYGWGMGSQTAASTLNSIPIGLLDVRIGDNRTHKIVWRGTASGVLVDKSGKTPTLIKQAIAKMFSSYPPKKTTLFSSTKSYR